MSSMSDHLTRLSAAGWLVLVSLDRGHTTQSLQVWWAEMVSDPMSVLDDAINECVDLGLIEAAP